MSKAPSFSKRIPLVEVFGPTISGEGAALGQQTYFLRFGLCDYECTMCDSMHAVDPRQVKANARWLTQEEIYQNFMLKHTINSTPWVTFSGGNPCIHDLTHLVERLIEKKIKIAVETQGTFSPDWLTMCDAVTVSPKGPGMGEQFEEAKFRNFLHRNLSAIKVVVFNDEDIKFAERIYDIATDKGCEDQFYLSQGNPFPADNKITLTELTWELRKHYFETFEKIKNHPTLSRVKFLPQWHVWLFGNKQGV